MNDLIDRTSQLHHNVNRSNKSGNNEYLLISDFGTSSVTSDAGFIYPYFRLFTPVKPERGRKLNSIYDPLNPFDYFKDSLMDYPTIVRSKLTGSEDSPFQVFNKLVSVHVSRCPLNCWHCYLEECLRTNCATCFIGDQCKNEIRIDLGIKDGWFSANEILESFIKQREIDKENSTNILRLTGGEPFLVPNLILELLRKIKSLNLNHEIFLWTETNLIPFIESDDILPIVTEDQLNDLSKYNNFCVHPCFHGLSESSFEKITGISIPSFDLLLNAFKRLLDAGIDVYPTFGSNVCNPDEVERFFNNMRSFEENLPLRFCLIEYDLNYKPIKWREENIKGFPSSSELIYNKSQIIKKWNSLLEENLKVSYGNIPRHKITLNRKKDE